MLLVSFIIALSAVSAFTLISRIGSRQITRSLGQRRISKYPETFAHRINTRTKPRSIYGKFPEVAEENKIAELIVLSERYLTEEILMQNALYSFKISEMFPMLYSHWYWNIQTESAIKKSILNEHERAQIKEKIQALTKESGYDALKAEDDLIIQLETILARDKLSIPDNYLTEIDPIFADYVMKIANRQLIDSMIALPIGEEGAKKVIAVWNEMNSPFSLGYITSLELNYFIFDPMMNLLAHFVPSNRNELVSMLSDYTKLTAPFARALELQQVAPSDIRTLEWIRGPQIDVLARLKAHINSNSITFKE